MLEKRKNGFNSFDLKVIAVVIMTIDHIAALGFPMSYDMYLLFRTIGRIAAPIFLFLIVEGLRNTHSKPKYLLRLYIAGAFITISNELVLNIIGGETSFGNILPTFMYVAIYVICIDAIRKSLANKSIKGILIGGLVIVATIIVSLVYNNVGKAMQENLIGMVWQILAPSIFEIDYSLLFVLLGIAWYYINSNVKRSMLFVILSILIFAVTSVPIIQVMDNLPFNFYQLFAGVQGYMILATPFFLMYNGEKGARGKYFFYIYYPVHQYIIAIVVSLLI